MSLPAPGEDAQTDALHAVTVLPKQILNEHPIDDVQYLTHAASDDWDQLGFLHLSEALFVQFSLQMELRGRKGGDAEVLVYQ